MYIQEILLLYTSTQWVYKVTSTELFNLQLIDLIGTGTVFCKVRSQNLHCQIYHSSHVHVEAKAAGDNESMS